MASYTITSEQPTPLYPAGLQGPLLLTNQDPANTIWVNDLPNAEGFPLEPFSSLAWEDHKALYAYVQLGQAAVLACFDNTGNLTPPAVILPGSITSTSLADGSITLAKLAANPSIPEVTVQGTCLTGIYVPGSPLRTLYRRQTGVSDANGLIIVACPNTAVLHVDAVNEAAANYVLFLRTESDGSKVVWQTRDIVDGSAVGNIPYTIAARIEYQNGA
jgi:hypothetical protein